jgi:two-component system, NtrC family, response regulator HydG
MSRKFGKILVVDDEDDILTAVRLFLKQHFAVVQTEKDPSRILPALASDHFDVILLDMNFSTGITSGKEGLFWLNKILEQDASSVIIMMTAYGEIDLAVKAIREGAMDFVVKPWQNEKLLATVMAAMQLRSTRLEVKQLRQREHHLKAQLNSDFTEFIGESKPMQKVYSAIDKVARTDANLLLLGENGTGKELVARSVHNHSNRAGEAFISVDLGSISETLFESELFGHTKGAFTDAKEDRIGRFELASKGTLFLDEIGNLSLPLQAKLLSAIQGRQITRVGSNKPIPVDIRLICATNMPVYDMVAQNRFRQDLLYRINTIEIMLPPLREREGDIALLAQHFLGMFRKKYGKPGLHFSPTTLRKLEKYSWPGNVRELQHAIERAVIMTDSELIQPSDFSFSLPEDREARREGASLSDLEKSTIRKVISKHGGNISQAAKELGLTRAALYRRIEKYGL